jgi:hypothetical protein
MNDLDRCENICDCQDMSNTKLSQESGLM